MCRAAAVGMGLLLEDPWAAGLFTAAAIELGLKGRNGVAVRQ